MCKLVPDKALKNIQMSFWYVHEVLHFVKIHTEMYSFPRIYWAVFATNTLSQ